MKDKLQQLITEYENRRLWGSIELTFRNGAIEVISKSETIKEQPHVRTNHNTR